MFHVEDPTGTWLLNYGAPFEEVQSFANLEANKEMTLAFLQVGKETLKII